MFSSFKPEKSETQVRLCKARLGLQKNKRTMAIKQLRKEIAQLLRDGKQEYARIRVEGVIRENLLMQAYEILGLYLELIAVRSQLISKTKEIPRDMVEAISSIIYAAQRISDVPELISLRALFASKYSKEYAAEASSDVTCAKWQVNANLIRCLLVEPPQPEEKLQMLSEIAQEHGVEWDLSAAARELLPPGTMMPAGASVPAAPPPAEPQQQQQFSLGPQQAQLAASGPAPNVHIMDPQQAAAAAGAAAAHARAMADWANDMALQFAINTNPNMPQPQGGPPPMGWLAAPLSGGPSQVAPPPPPAAGGPPPPVARTNEEIQRAYDQAVGPPTKGGLAPPPGAPASSQLPSVPRPPVDLPSAPDRAADPAVPQLPRPPQGFGPAEPEDEYDELSRRLDALKRS